MKLKSPCGRHTPPLSPYSTSMQDILLQQAAPPLPAPCMPHDTEAARLYDNVCASPLNPCDLCLYNPPPPSP
jgi:hypothetical protein